MKINHLKFILIAIAVLYFALPRDLVPDVGWIGRIDDAVLIYLLVRFYLRKKAQRVLRDDAAASEAKSMPGDGEQSTAKVAADPYQVLGIKRGASREEITAAYKREAAKYHPDKVGHLGEELQRLAHERTLAIIAAYEQLKN